MKKNVASQKIGAQMVSATDGSAFTGAVTVSVTGDAGAQATGSVGAGACTHEGNGYHTYAPAQAETNYDLIAFTFTGTGAVPATVQVFTSFPQTGDSYERIGAPAGASIAADLVTIDNFIDTEIAAISSSIAALNDISAAEVNAEVVDALTVDTYAQPGQETPAATTSLKNMLAYLYKGFRNRKDTTAAGAFKLYNDDAVTVDQKSTLTDDAVTFTTTELISGP